MGIVLGSWALQCYQHDGPVNAGGSDSREPKWNSVTEGMLIPLPHPVQTPMIRTNLIFNVVFELVLQIMKKINENVFVFDILALRS